MRGEGPIRVMLVEDSAIFRRMLAEALNRQPGIRVVAAAADAFEARDAILREHPEIIILDLELPKVDGLSFLRQLREHYPVPVIVCTGTTPRNGPAALRAVELGALEVMIKPSGMDRTARDALFADLAARIRAAVAHARPFVRSQPVRMSVVPQAFREAGLNPARFLVVIGASTGGTEAILSLLRSAPADFPPTAIVQHMPVQFTASFADRLNRLTPLRVQEAVEAGPLTPGSAVVARGDTHLTVRRVDGMWRAHYTNQTPVNRHCPSVEPLFDSAALHARCVIGVLLTGMGADGAAALLRLRRAGALTVAQSRESCVVYGMPKAAIEMGAAELTRAPEEIPAAILEALQQRAAVRKPG